MLDKAERVACLAQTHLQNAGFTVPKFAKFLLDAERSSAVLKRASMLRSSHPSAHRMNNLNFTL